MKPILFNTEMVKAILEGRKTSTRRIIKNKYENANIEWFENKYGKRLVYMQNDAKVIKNSDGSENRQLRVYEEIKPPYQVGDILYVRETWTNTFLSNGIGFAYKADGDPPKAKRWGNLKQGKAEVWIPSIHMPKSAARIFLKVTDIKVQKLQDITEDEAQQEGIIEKFSYDDYTQKIIHSSNDNYKYGFAKAWRDCGYEWSYTWEGNPWVFVISFQRADKEE